MERYGAVLRHASHLTKLCHVRFETYDKCDPHGYAGLVYRRHAERYRDIPPSHWSADKDLHALALVDTIMTSRSKVSKWPSYRHLSPHLVRLRRARLFR